LHCNGRSVAAAGAPPIVKGPDMICRHRRWFDQRKRYQQLDEHISHSKIASFGFHQVPEEDKVKWVCRHFNSVAQRYDFMNTLLSFGIHHVWKRAAVRMMHIKPGDRVLDVCGGTGDLARLAAGRVQPGGKVVIYDINHTMMLAGKPRLKDPVLRPTIDHVQGDAEKISFPDSCFDAAMVGFGIRNVTHMKQGFAEMHRILKPGGRFMCLEFSKPTAPVFRWLYDMYSFFAMPFLGELLAGSRQAYTHLPETIRLFPLPDELSSILENIGFSDVHYQRLTNGIAVVHTGIRT